jgi:imidazolonepropionase
MKADFLLKGAREIVTTRGASKRPLSGRGMREITAIPRGFLAAKDGRIIAMGTEAELTNVDLAPGATVVDASGKVVVPGLVDPHTHLLFLGAREDEFFRRLDGESYMEIASKGGGIGKTVSATRAGGVQALQDRGREHLELMMRQGTTSVEVKTGYGLSVDGELAMLTAIDALKRQSPLDIVSTFLGAHAVPVEYRGRPDDFIQLVVDEMLPAVKHSSSAEFCDVFCEKGAFTVEQSRRVLRAAAKLGLKLKVHGDELLHSGGSALAAELKATSVDHCNFASPEDLQGLREAGTIAVALPATPFFLLAPRYADGRAIIAAEVPLALGSDYNPTSSISSMQFVMFLACLNMRLSPEEALAAATINAAHAVGLGEEVGSLEVGKCADALVLNLEDFRSLPFYVGRDVIDKVIKRGRIVHGKPDRAARRGRKANDAEAGQTQKPAEFTGWSPR